MLLTW